jgi:hypothetical protein
MLSGPFREPDLTKFKKYASRVRSYHYQQDVDDVDISGYIHVLQASGRSYIFPNLVHLTMSSELEVSKIMLLMSPYLRRFSMRGSSAFLVLRPLLITAPNVTHLTLSNVPLDLGFMTICNSYTRLEGISIEHKGNFGGVLPTFDLSLITTFSCKESLRYFTLVGLHITWVLYNSAHRRIVEFPLLETIDIGQCFLTSIGPIAELFRSVTLRSLKALPIMFIRSPTRLVEAVEARHWCNFFEHIGRATTMHFKTLQITINNLHPVEEIRECWKHIGLTITSFPNFDKLTLETFSILPPFLSSLGRNDLQKVISSWPNLSRLELSSCRHSELGFMALVDIALGLPRLEYLEIPLNVQEAPDFEEIPLLAHNLQEIGLDTLVPLKESKLLVQCIDKIFPYVKSCSFYHGDHLVWQDISSFLSMLRSARKDELRRATLGITGV